jgi:hypothetical protein
MNHALSITALPRWLELPRASESLTWRIASAITLTPITNQPGIAINLSSSVIFGTIASGNFTPTIIVTDSIVTASETFYWKVNSPITLVALNTLQNNEGDVVSIHIKATDSTSGSTVSYAAAGLPNGLSINSSTGLITGTVASGYSNNGAFSPVITVTDGTAVASEEFTWNINSPITLAAVADQQSTEGAVVSLSILASDSTSGVTLKYGAAGLPNGLSINSSTGLISGTIAAGTANLGEAYSPVITVSDGTAVATLGFNWNVSSAITIGGITTQRSSVGSTASVSVTATDANSLAMTYSAEGLPPGLAINVSTGVISGTIATGAANISTVYSPLITVTDGTAVATQGFTWNLASPIDITGLFTQNSSEGSSVSLSVVATDANSLALTYAAMGLPSGLTINVSTGLISGTIAAGAANAGAATPVITVTDGTSTASENFTWNLSSAIALGSIPTQTSSEGSVVSVSFTVSNGNSLSVTLSAEGLPAGVTLNHTTGLITGTIAAGAADNGPAYPVITATDGTSTTSESFTWNLSSAITMGTIATQTSTEGNSVNLTVTATDANSLSVTYTAVGLPAGISLNETTGVISGTIAAGAAANGAAYPVITATDGTAVTSETFTWNLSSAISIGTISPLVSTLGSSVSVSVSATDAYSLALTYTASGLPDGVNINSSTGLISGTVAANASSGASLTPVITVSDGTSSNSISLTWSIGATVVDDSFNTQENTALTVAASAGVLSVDTAPAGTTLTATLLTTTSDGTLSLAANGSFVYTPASNWTGTDSFTYAASDGSVTSAPVTVSIQTDLTLPQSNNNFVAVATGDFNGDGNQDFVAANNSTNAISVFLGNGDGTFQTPTVISVGTGPDALAVGNFGNGAEDIAVANGTAGTVTILMNNGTGTFTATQTLTVGTNPVSLALGDFEGNGNLDLAVANEGSNTMSVFLNNGSGTFTLDTTITVGTSPSSVAAGDMNGDGFDDLVVANSGSNNISVLLSNGNGTFATAVNYTVGTTPSAVVVADLNSNGVMDVAVANSGSNTVTVLLGLNNGLGTLGSATNYTVGSDPVALATGDVTGDGISDLVVINHSSSNETVLSNDGTGEFAATQTIALGESADSVALGDFAHTESNDQIIDNTAEDVPPNAEPKEITQKMLDMAIERFSKSKAADDELEKAKKIFPNLKIELNAKLAPGIRAGLIFNGNDAVIQINPTPNGQKPLMPLSAPFCGKC